MSCHHVMSGSHVSNFNSMSCARSDRRMYNDGTCSMFQYNDNNNSNNNNDNNNTINNIYISYTLCVFVNSTLKHTTYINIINNTIYKVHSSSQT